MEEIQAGVLNVKMKYIEKWTKGRRNASALYTKLIKAMNLSEVVCPFNPDYINPVYHLYVIMAKNRDALSKHLNDNGIQTGLHYPIPLHKQAAYAYLNHKEGDFPVAEECCSRILSIPMYPEIPEEQIDFVCKTIEQFYRK
jgi:dTDP-4-amino-4,6-dideoxygalactose transaminase